MIKFDDSTFTPIAKIEINKLKRNLNFIKSKLNDESLIAVVKSDAYGHGLEISQYMEKICDGFGVSRLDEAIKLRYLGIKKPIMMLVPLTIGDMRLAISYDVQVLCYHLNMLSDLKTLAKNQRVSVNFKIDANMNRLGFNSLNSFLEAISAIKKIKNIRVCGIYSHFSNSCSIQSCTNQFDIFSKFLSVFDDNFCGLRHISASGGLMHQRFNLNAVRVGLLMYGYKPFECDAQVEPIMKIVAKPIIKKVFGLNDRCMYDFDVKKGLYSLCNYGYADGLFRAAEPLRCMDLSFIKSRFREVVIMDDAKKIADLNNTIPYEILTKCAIRIKKEYIEGL